MTVANKMRELSLRNKEKLDPEKTKVVFDSFVDGVAQAAQAGLMGTPFFIEVEEEDVVYITHVIGDLRSEGFNVQVVSLMALDKQSKVVSMNLFVTW